MKPSKSRRFAAVLGPLVALLALCGARGAHAFAFCVNNPASLQVAMSLGNLQQSAYTIMVEQGTYMLSGQTSGAMSAPTTLLGGYTPGCASRVVDPANTVIDIGLGHGFQLINAEASPEARIDVDGVTFRNTDVDVVLFAGSFVPLFSDHEGSVHVSNVRFTDIHGDATSISIGAYVNEVTLENVLIDHVDTTEPAPNNCSVFISSYANAYISIDHLTADMKSGNTFCLYDGLDRAHMELFNSIIWNSDGGSSDIEVTGDTDTDIAIFNDIFHGATSTGALNIQGALHVAPGWIDPAAGNYGLKTSSPVSPAINTGTTVVPYGEPVTDIEGHPRTIGSAPDRGAYESPFNDQAILIVSNTNDSGAGSLRQAMLDANSTPSIAKAIRFDIRGANQVPVCPAIIALSSALPNVGSTMSIDGYTQPLSVKNTDATAFNANLCIIVKPASGTLPVGFRIPATGGAADSLTLKGLGIGGFGQPVQLLGGRDDLIAGNQFGGTANGIALPGASLSAINIGVNAGGSLIVGGPNPADRNVIGGAAFDGVDIQSGVASSIDRCQIVNNLIGVAPDGHTANPNSFGVNVSGSGCGIVRNRIVGNSIANIWLNGTASGTVVQQNWVGITTQNAPVLNNATGILVTGHDNVIGAGGNGGLLTANLVRFNVAGGVVVKGTAATGNSVNANLIYDNGASANGMDIDLLPTNGASGPSPNDGGDADSGPNQQQNFPVAKGIAYTGPGPVDRPALVSGLLDTQPGLHRIDAYFSNAANPVGRRGHAEQFLGRMTVGVTAGVRQPFSMAVLVPNPSATGVISFTATDAAGNTSEIGTALATDAIFVDGAE